MILDKRALRLEWIKKRQAIPDRRRIEASIALSKQQFPSCVIASFVSFRDEIDTAPLNMQLARKELLALPKIEPDGLSFYLVNDLGRQLDPSSFGILEPIPSLCTPATNLHLILVPGLAFDHDHHRLGYGKGHYDRYLANHSIHSIGIGFKEQLTAALPNDPHDIALSEIALF